MQVGMTLEGKIGSAIAPSLDQFGFDLVKVKMVSNDNRNILQIMIERADGTSVSVGDCEKVSRQISAVLDVENLISDKYTLEVGSPGIDRPLTRLKDFEKYKGLEAKIEVIDKVDGIRKFRGRLSGLDGDVVLLNANIIDINKPEDAEDLRIEFSNVKSAKLVLTDELLAMHKSNNI